MLRFPTWQLDLDYLLTQLGPQLQLEETDRTARYGRSDCNGQAQQRQRERGALFCVALVFTVIAIVCFSR